MLNPDFRDMLSEFVSSEVEFLLVGADALAAQGYPRSTGDIDLWVRADVETGNKVFGAITSTASLSTSTTLRWLTEADMTDN